MKTRIGQIQGVPEPGELDAGKALRFVGEGQFAWANEGAGTFLGLTDAPSSYEGQAGKVVLVNGTGTGLEFSEGGTTVDGIEDVPGLPEALDELDARISAITIPEIPEGSGLTEDDVAAMIANALGALTDPETGGGTVFDVDVSAGNATVDEADFLASDTLNVTGATANNRTVTLPQTAGTVAIVSARANTKTVTVQRGTTSYKLAKGAFVLVYLDGSANHMKVLASSLAGHTHPVSDIEATGTADATSFLRGDGSWAEPAAGGSSPAITIVRLTAQQSILSTAFTPISWTAEDRDDAGAFTLADPTKITVPSGYTKMRLAWHTVTDGTAGTTNVRHPLLVKNGNPFQGSHTRASYGTGVTDGTQWLTVTPGDVFVLQYWQDSGVTIKLDGAGFNQCWLQAEFLP